MKVGIQQTQGTWHGFLKAPGQFQTRTREVFFLPALKQLHDTPSLLRHSVSLSEAEQDLLFHHTARGTPVPTAPNIKGPSQGTWCSGLPCLWATSKAYLEDFSNNTHFFDPDICSGVNRLIPPGSALSPSRNRQ